MPELVDSQHRWVLMPEPARVRKIDSLSAARAFEEEYVMPLPDELAQAAAAAKVPESTLAPLRGLDWERVARDCDAVHLTNRGFAAIRGSGALKAMESVFWGWDCESTLWLCWCFREARRLDRK